VRGAELKNTPSLSQALMNLLNNAAQVSEVIDVEACRHNSTLQISIRDYGPGIPAELLNQIGHSVLSQSENGMGMGMGMGLFLTHATIERIGGSIAMDNHPDGGTLTLVSIPFERAASHD
jgi:two-component system sensor histidine kinase RegB